MAGADGAPYCSECGGEYMPHAARKMELYFEDAMEPLFAPIERLDKRVRRVLLRMQADRAALPIFRALARMHLGSLKSELDPRDSIRTKALYEGASAAGVKLWQFRPFDADVDGFFVARKGAEELVFSILPRPRGFFSPSADWMDDKGKIIPYLRSRGIPAAEGGVARTPAQAEAIFAKIGPPAIAKPHRGTRGRHTILGIRTIEELRRGFAIAEQLSPKVVIERELQGIVHRVTLVGGSVAAIATRDYPHVIGDGVATVQQLIDRENLDPRRDDVLFHKITRSDRGDAQLKKQGLWWDSIPAKEQRVVLSDKVSRLQGTVTIDVTDGAHPENIALFEKIGEVMGDPLIGMDFIIADVSRPWKEQPDCGVIELNAMPYIDVHHWVYAGTPRNVAKVLWDCVFEQGTY